MDENKGRASYHQPESESLGVNADEPLVAALNSAQFGSSAPDVPSPALGRRITIQAKDQRVEATIVDELRMAPFASLSFSPNLFEIFAPLNTGIVQVTWWFNEQPEPIPNRFPPDHYPNRSTEAIPLVVTSAQVSPADLDILRARFSESDLERSLRLEVIDHNQPDKTLDELFQTYRQNDVLIILDERTDTDESVLYLTSGEQDDILSLRTTANSIADIYRNVSIGNISFEEYQEFASSAPNGIYVNDTNYAAIAAAEAARQEAYQKQVILRRNDCIFEGNGRWAVKDSSAERLGLGKVKRVWFEESVDDIWLDPGTDELGMSAVKWM